MRSITILCSCILALSLLAAPAKADPSNNTSNTVFIVFDFGGFSGDSSSESFEYDGTANLLIINLASVLGDFEDFGGLSFFDLDLDGMDLTGLSYFILGHVTGSDHLILSADGDGAPLDDTFEAGIEGGVMNMDGLDPNLGTGGGMAFVTAGDFMDQFGGFGIGGFVGGTGDIPFDTVGVVGGEVDLLGFSDPTLLGHFSINGDGTSTFTPVPEPGLALLVIMGLAGTVIARRRRRQAA